MIKITMFVLFMAVWVCVGCGSSTPLSTPLTESEKQLVRDVLKEAELHPDGSGYRAAQHALDEIKENHAVLVFRYECAAFGADILIYSNACAARDYDLKAARTAALDAARDGATPHAGAIIGAANEEHAKAMRYSDSAQVHYKIMKEVGMMLLRDELNNPRIEELWSRGQSPGE